MKRFFRFLLFFLFISLNAAPKELIFHAEYCPPFICSQNSDSPGFAVEVLKAVYPEKDFRISIRFWGWQSAARELKRNKISAYIGMSKADYPEFPVPRYPIYHLQSAVYAKSDLDLKYTGPESLAKIKTGFQVDYSHSNEFDAYQKQHEKDGSLLYYRKNRAAEMLKDLASGKIQAFVLYTAAVRWALLNQPKFRQSLKRISLLDNSTDFYVVFSRKKDSNELIRIFNRRFPEFIKTEKYRALLRKYALDEN